ncbi:retrovirus-related pol polyprotein from transposon TNT 1-94 [Tanacetum coccineum]
MSSDLFFYTSSDDEDEVNSELAAFTEACQAAYEALKPKVHRTLVEKDHYDSHDRLVMAYDCTGQRSISALMKCTSAIRQMAYGTVPDALDEYLQMGATTACDSLRIFCKFIMNLYGEEFLRKPTYTNMEKLYAYHNEKHGFPRMLGSIDSSNDLWIWHAFFGVSGMNNDVNVLRQSSLFNDLKSGRAPYVPFVANNVPYKRGYYLTDGIYPQWYQMVVFLRLSKSGGMVVHDGGWRSKDDDVAWAVVRLPRAVGCNIDENRFPSIPRPSQRSLINETDDNDVLEVPDKVSEEVVVQQPELRKRKGNRTPKSMDDPKTSDEAMKSHDVAFWKDETNDEMDSIMGNNTWVLTDLPPSCKTFGLQIENETTPATVRARTYTDLTNEEKIRESVDIKATNIVLQVQQSQYQPQVVTHSPVVHQQPYQAPALQQSYQAPAIQQPSSTELDSGLVVPSFNPSDDPIANLNKLMAFITTSFAPRFPQTNNQLRTLSNPRNQATIQDGRVTVKGVAAFQINDLDAFDYDCDDAPSAKAVLMANLSFDDLDLLSEEILELAEESRLKMLAKQNDLSLKEKKVNIAPVDYMALNKLSEHFVKHFVPQKQLFAEQAFWLPISQPVSKKSPVPSLPILRKEIPQLKEMKVVFNQMETEVAKCSVDRKYFEIEKKEISLDNDRLLEHIICQDVMNIMMHVDSLPVNVLPANTKCRVHDNLEIGRLERENDHLFELLLSQDIAELANKKENMVEKKFLMKLSRCSRLENHSVNLEHRLQHQKEIFLNNRPFNNQTAPEIQEFFHINEWQAKLDAKDVSIAKLKKHIKNLKGKNMVDKDATPNNAKVIALGMFKFDLEPLAPRVSNNKDAHIDYIKHSREHADTLREIVEHARALRPLDSDLYSACKIVQRIQEVLVYVKDTCPCLTKPSKKLVAITPLNKNKKVRFAELATSSSNTQKHIDSNKTQNSNKLVLPSIEMKSSTSASRSQPSSNTKNNRISCSKHMIGNHSQLIYFVHKFLGTVIFRDYQISKIMGYGDYQLGNVTISQVYYVKGLGHNLFSVGQFCDSDLEVAFRKHTSYVQNLDGADLLSRSRDTNLYTISLDDMLKSSPICLLSKASKTKSWLWHRRLSHLNFGTLNQLAKQGLVKGLQKLKFEKDHLCSACSLRKSKKYSHKPKADDTNQEKLYLLHMDLCWD